jgi:hypothetical protein
MQKIYNLFLNTQIINHFEQFLKNLQKMFLLQSLKRKKIKIKIINLKISIISAQEFYRKLMTKFKFQKVFTMVNGKTINFKGKDNFFFKMVLIIKGHLNKD